MYIHYVGFDAAPTSRTYTFRVVDAPGETRHITVKVQAEAFRRASLNFQDGPAICFARLRREQDGETEESRAEAHLRIVERDVQEYLERHNPRTSKKSRPPSQ